MGEIQSLTAKAARGAGRPFGVAEDAGFAVRWLCERGLDGAGALDQLLKRTDQMAPRDLAPEPGTLAPALDVICPLCLGAYLADQGEIPSESIGPVLLPVLLLPFLALIAPVRGSLRLEVGRDQWAVLGDNDEMQVCDGSWPGEALVRVSAMDAATDGSRDRQLRATVAADVIASLSAFAARTYAPATEESRLRGAGAGVSDND